MKADILREKFLAFFKSRKHRIVESDSLVPKEDPTVLFTPAGMNQFKKQFLGQLSGFTSAATSQRCLRTDDLDKVGKTTGHHTFFEMLGNFSFGDYFKPEAIALAWEFLTEELKIPGEKLWVSVYQDDDEAYLIWKDKIKVPAGKIVKLGDKENFWPSEAKEKGPNGPCGPCSEIFYDFGQGKGCGEALCDPSCDCGRFVEIWNLVFTQFNRKEGGKLEPLPRKNIDTGMGLERLAAVMQGVKNNFETDLFQPIIKEINQEVSLRGAGGDEANPKKHDCFGTSCLAMTHAIADHIRAVVFSIYDGVLPSNDGRGYVIRKLIRKSVLHLRALGIEKPFLNRLVPVLAEVMRVPYPELEARRENIAEIVLAEEKNFIRTLETSGTLLQDKFKGLLENYNLESAGKIAFQLYDTYGIPLELTANWLKNKGLKFSLEVFNQELEGQKKRSKTQSSMKGDVFSIKELASGLKETKFLGYKQYETKAKVLKIIKDGQEVKKISQGEAGEIILDQTPFYAESGGQAGDSGCLLKGKNSFEVNETKKIEKAFAHCGKAKAGSFKKGDLVLAEINLEERLDIARNHTATHLLQAALRKVLGAHVQQQGSLVTAQRLRFDFTHFKGLSNEELEEVEGRVNGFILGNYPLSSKSMPLASARKTKALAFFAEKYEGTVRVVSIGDFSKEFCGGTHLQSTGQIGSFKIIREGSVASGIRRIEAVAGRFALKAQKEELEAARQELEKGVTRIKELEKQLKSQRSGGVKDLSDEAIKEAEEINGKKVISKNLEQGFAIPEMSSLLDSIKQKSENTIIGLMANNTAAGKALLVVGVTADLAGKGISALGLFKELEKVTGFRGGGRPDFAQGGSAKLEDFARVSAEFKSIIAKIR